MSAIYLIYNKLDQNLQYEVSKTGRFGKYEELGHLFLTLSTYIGHINEISRY
jgi:hypothetical protein